MLDAMKQLINAIVAFQNNAPALVTAIALAAMALTGFAMYVILTLVKH